MVPAAFGSSRELWRPSTSRGASRSAASATVRPVRSGTAAVARTRPTTIATRSDGVTGAPGGGRWSSTAHGGGPAFASVSTAYRAIPVRRSSRFAWAGVMPVTRGIVGGADTPLETVSRTLPPESMREPALGRWVTTVPAGCGWSA